MHLSGGAGVGKSVVLHASYQTLYRLLNLKEGEKPDDIRVLLCAYTSKAHPFERGIKCRSRYAHLLYIQNEICYFDRHI